MTDTVSEHSPERQIITHMVLLRIREEIPECATERVFKEIESLQTRIGGILSYAWGRYSSPEGLGRGYTHAFCMTFTDAEARDAYLPHPEHEKVKDSVLAIVEGGFEGVLAFDFAS
jgi:hypothetical protein